MDLYLFFFTLSSVFSPLQPYVLTVLKGCVEVQPCALHGAGGEPCLGACL